jgi:sugar fermentation stimulation protein A
MTYNNTLSAVFISRPNRFIAKIDINGKTEIAHVKNTGRCKELLVPGAKVILQQADNPKRTTKYDLIAVYKSDRLINMDSQAPNQAFYEQLKSGKYMSGITLIKSEARYGSSRFDFYVKSDERKIFIEVKGVTLEENGVVLFPDAPTLRGVKHLNELAQCVQAGYEAKVVFIIQMKDVLYFTPNNKTHPEFGAALSAAYYAGVKVVALDCVVTENSMSVGDPVLVKLADELIHAVLL